MKSSNKNDLSPLERVRLERKAYIAELKSAFEESYILECKQIEINKQAGKVLDLLNELDSDEGQSWEEELSHIMHTFNVSPSSTARDYLAKANYAGSINESLKKDWESIGGDLWVSLANVMKKNKDAGVK
jgi:hypothetical protein